MTGAASGIGRAAPLALAREGASVVVADVSERDNQKTGRLIEEQGGRALAVRCDVTRAEDVRAALESRPQRSALSSTPDSGAACPRVGG